VVLGNAALAWVGILSAVCASQLAVALANWTVTVLARPHRFPRMDFVRGIPPESRTLVVIPTMLVSCQNIRNWLEDLEVRFLANQDENLPLRSSNRFPRCDGRDDSRGRALTVFGPDGNRGVECEVCWGRE